MLKGYRTVVFNIVIGGIMLVNQIWGSADQPIADPNVVTESIDKIDIGLTVIWTVGNIIFRAITNTAIGQKT